VDSRGNGPWALAQPSENGHRLANDEGTRRIALRPARWLRDAAAVLAEPIPSASITFECSPIYCSDVSKGAVPKGAVLTAVAGLGYPVKTVTIGLFNQSCGVPPAPCPPADTLPTAWVSFAGTDKIAIVKIGTVTGGPGIDSVVSFEVPPPGPSFP
jgi:hypothetical protein